MMFNKRRKELRNAGVRRLHVGRSFLMQDFKWKSSTLRRLAVAVLLQMAAGTLALRDVVVSIPKVVSSGGAANLDCRWSLDEGETLYSVKWYRSRQEFYRYLPKELPHTRVFTHEGINVDLSRSGEHQVVLEGLTRNLTGHYRCEVSADAPSFHTEQSSSYMHVVDLPHSAPVLLAEKAWYSVGDVLRANCSSPPADPPASIAWMVNGRLVSGMPTHQNSTVAVHIQDHLKPDTPDKSSPTTSTQTTPPSKTSPISVRSTWIRRPSVGILELQITPEYFDTGRIKLVCVASVHTIYSAQAELELQEEKPQIASVLDTRDAAESINSGKTGLQSLPAAIIACLLLTLR